LLVASTASFQAFADNWQPLTGADTQRELVSGATAEIQMNPCARDALQRSGLCPWDAVYPGGNAVMMSSCSGESSTTQTIRAG